MKRFLPLLMVFSILFSFLVPTVSHAGAYKFIDTVAKMSGMSVTDELEDKLSRHVIKKLSDDGKIVTTEEWLNAHKTKSTKKSYGGKFLKYTVALSPLLTLVSDVGSAVNSNVIATINGEKTLVFQEPDSQFKWRDMIGQFGKYPLNTGNSEFFYTPGCENCSPDEMHYDLNALMYDSYYGYYYQQVGGMHTKDLGYEPIVSENTSTGEIDINYYTRYQDFDGSYTYQPKTESISMESLPHLYGSDGSFQSPDLANSEPVNLDDPVDYGYIVSPDEYSTTDGSEVPQTGTEVEVYVPTTEEGEELAKEYPNVITNPNEYEEQITNLPEPEEIPQTDETGQPIEEEVVPEPEPEPEPVPDTDDNSLIEKILTSIESLIMTIISLLEQILNWLKVTLGDWLSTFGDLFSNIWNSILDIYSTVLDILDYMLNVMSTWFETFAEGFINIYDWLVNSFPLYMSDILSALNPLSFLSSINGLITNILNFLNGLVQSFMNALEGMLNNLFVPSPDFLMSAVQSTKTSIEGKFPDIDKIPAYISSIDGTCSVMNNVQITVFGVTATVLDYQYLNDASTWFRPIMSAFIWLLVVAYGYKKVTAILSARGGV